MSTESRFSVGILIQQKLPIQNENKRKSDFLYKTKGFATVFTQFLIK